MRSSAFCSSVAIGGSEARGILARLEVALGRGSADFPWIFGALSEFGYKGYFTVERQRAENPLEEISLAVQYLRNLL